MRCPQCQQEFSPHHNKQKFCTKRCSNQAFEVRRLARLKAERAAAKGIVTEPVELLSYQEFIGHFLIPNRTVGASRRCGGAA